MQDFILRAATKDDLAYIHKSWKEHLHKMPEFKAEHKLIFDPDMQEFFDFIFAHPKTKIMILSPKDDVQHIACYAIFSVFKKGTVLWWIHVRDIYRKKGLCTNICKTIPAPVYYIFNRKIAGEKAFKTVIGDRLKFTYWYTFIFKFLKLES